jgi:hypothetical protein
MTHKGSAGVMNLGHSLAEQKLPGFSGIGPIFGARAKNYSRLCSDVA